MNSAHAFSMEAIHNKNMLATLNAERQELAEAKAEISSKLATLKKDLAATRAILTDDEAFLEDFEATFKVKNATFAQNQQVRQEEIMTIGKAVEILSSPEVQESYAK